MLYQQIARNKRKTVVVMVVFSLILATAGGGLGLWMADNLWLGILFALIATAIYLAITLKDPARMVMALNHAKECHEEDDPELFHVVEDMAMVARIPMPRVFIISDASPNAFATGRDPQHAAIAVTSGLREMMTREELEGVLGHEVSHIKNYDILLATISLVMVGVITMIANLAARLMWWGGSDDDRDDNKSGSIIKLVLMLFTLVLAPLAATLAQLALSRNREFLADASSVQLTRNPQGLINALERISQSKPMKAADPSSAAMYFTNPFKKKRLVSLFDTHPATPDRIARLEKM